jgi:hypothetical protein
LLPADKVLTVAGKKESFSEIRKRLNIKGRHIIIK